MLFPMISPEGNNLIPPDTASKKRWVVTATGIQKRNRFGICKNKTASTETARAINGAKAV